MDVCDDTAYSQRAKALHQRAADAGVPAITTTGIYPGALCCLAVLHLPSADSPLLPCAVGCSAPLPRCGMIWPLLLQPGDVSSWMQPFCRHVAPALVAAAC